MVAISSAEAFFFPFFPFLFFKGLAVLMVMRERESVSISVVVGGEIIPCCLLTVFFLTSALKADIENIYFASEQIRVFDMTLLHIMSDLSASTPPFIPHTEPNQICFITVMMKTRDTYKSDFPQPGFYSKVLYYCQFCGSACCH